MEWLIVIFLMIIVALAGAAMIFGPGAYLLAYQVNRLVERYYAHYGPFSFSRKNIREKLKKGLTHFDYEAYILQLIDNGKKTRKERKIFIHFGIYVFSGVLVWRLLHLFGEDYLIAYYYIVMIGLALTVYGIGSAWSSKNLSDYDREVFDALNEYTDNEQLLAILEHAAQTFTNPRFTKYLSHEKYYILLKIFIDRQTEPLTAADQHLLSPLLVLPDYKTLPFLEEEYGKGKISTELYLRWNNRMKINAGNIAHPSALYKLLKSPDLTDETLKSLSQVSIGESEHIRLFAGFVLKFRQSAPTQPLFSSVFFKYILDGGNRNVLAIFVLMYVAETGDLDFAPSVFEYRERVKGYYEDIEAEPPSTVFFRYAKLPRYECRTYERNMLKEALDKLITEFHKVYPSVVLLPAHRTSHYIYCRQHLRRTRSPQPVEGFDPAEPLHKIELCPECKHGHPYEKGVKEVVGVIGREFFYQFENDTARVGLWDEANQSSRPAEIDRLSYEADYLSDRSAVSVTESLRTFHNEQTLEAPPVSSNEGLSENVIRLWETFFRVK